MYTDEKQNENEQYNIGGAAVLDYGEDDLVGNNDNQKLDDGFELGDKAMPMDVQTPPKKGDDDKNLHSRYAKKATNYKKDKKNPESFESLMANVRDQDSVEAKAGDDLGVGDLANAIRTNTANKLGVSKHWVPDDQFWNIAVDYRKVRYFKAKDGWLKTSRSFLNLLNEFKTFLFYLSSGDLKASTACKFADQVYSKADAYIKYAKGKTKKGNRGLKIALCESIKEDMNDFKTLINNIDNKTLRKAFLYDQKATGELNQQDTVKNKGLEMYNEARNIFGNENDTFDTNFQEEHKNVFDTMQKMMLQSKASKSYLYDPKYSEKKDSKKAQDKYKENAHECAKQYVSNSTNIFAQFISTNAKEFGLDDFLAIRFINSRSCVSEEEYYNNGREVDYFSSFFETCEELSHGSDVKETFPYCKYISTPLSEQNNLIGDAKFNKMRTTIVKQAENIAQSDNQFFKNAFGSAENALENSRKEAVKIFRKHIIHTINEGTSRIPLTILYEFCNIFYKKNVYNILTPCFNGLFENSSKQLDDSEIKQMAQYYDFVMGLMSYYATMFLNLTSTLMLGKNLLDTTEKETELLKFFLDDKNFETQQDGVQ